MPSLRAPGAAYAGDRGEADPAVRAALAAAGGAGSGDSTLYLRAVAALCRARLLMPIVTHGDEAADGPDPDRHTEMAAVSIQAADGRRAMLAFTGLDAVQAWEPAARPVPATLDELAVTVAEAGAEALLVDVAGPSPFVIEGPLVAELAQGHLLVELEPGEFGWAMAAQP